MKRFAPLFFIAIAAPALAQQMPQAQHSLPITPAPGQQIQPARQTPPMEGLPPPIDPVLWEARVRFEERVKLAKSAETDDKLRNYPHAMFKRAGRHISRSMRSCIARSPKPEEKTFVLVADITPKGKADAVEVSPDNAVSRCFAERFSSATFLKPPAYEGRGGFPVTLGVRVSP
ncbi:hypothetical protein GCM10027343_42210 [Noviherbaspirillum agri]